MMPSRPPDNPALTRAERQLRALEMRKLGMTYNMIGKALKLSPSSASRDVCAALQRLIDLNHNDAALLRQLEAERIDIAMPALCKRVRDGDLPAIDRWIKISQMRMRLLGLDKETDEPLETPKIVDESVDDDEKKPGQKQRQA